MATKKKFYLFLAALMIRLCVLKVGEVLDRTPGLHYTDIDYGVFSDGADLIVAGKSPYDRATYRYSPLLSLMLTPNSMFGKQFGKLLFILFDSLTGFLIHQMTPDISKGQMILSYILWDFNPFVINISTRGNSDSITCFLLVFTLFLLRNNHIILCAIIYGISVHMRLFPIFFVFTFFVFLKKKVFVFGIISFATFMALNFIFYYQYGDEFLSETFLYHLSRTDYKHNFAAPWLSNYLGKDPTKTWSLCRIILIIIISLSLGNEIEKCWTLIILCFIGFNTVCTVQYFDWSFALLALIPNYVMNKRFLFSVIFWTIAHVAWLLTAYLLEFRGKNVFVPLWVLSMIVFAGNNSLILALLKSKNEKEKEN